jgi:hypothetical protein
MVMTMTKNDKIIKYFQQEKTKIKLTVKSNIITLYIKSTSLYITI